MKFPWAKAPKLIARTAGKLGLWGSRHAPELLIGGGLTCFGGAMVVTAVQTPKVMGLIDKKRIDVAGIRQARENPDICYSEKEMQKDITMVYFRTGANIAKYYSPVIILAGTGVFCILYAHGIMLRREAVLMASYSALQKAYNIYRNRVIERYGEDADFYFRTGVERYQIATVEKDPVTGEDVKVVKDKATDVNHQVGSSMYARYFDEHSKCYTNTYSSNLLTLQQKQKYWNHILNQRGYVFLNEVYEDLDIPTEPFGQVVGWFQEPGTYERPLKFGIDNGLIFVDRTDGEVTDSAILLDFNVDGPVWEKLNVLDRRLKAAVSPSLLSNTRGRLVDQKTVVDL